MNLDGMVLTSEQCAQHAVAVSVLRRRGQACRGLASRIAIAAISA